MHRSGDKADFRSQQSGLSMSRLAIKKILSTRSTASVGGLKRNHLTHTECNRVSRASGSRAANHGQAMLQIQGTPHCGPDGHKALIIWLAKAKSPARVWLEATGAIP